MNVRNRPILAAAAALGLLTASGCGDLPTAPRLDSGTAAVGSAASSGLLAGGGGVDVGPDGGGVPVAPQGSPAIAATAGLLGETGGKIRLKDVSLDVPAHAFNGAAQISVTIPDSTKLEVHLEITPASKNHFDVPVRLTFDAGAGGRDARMMVIRWWNPADNQWVDIPTTADPKSGLVWADLAHFSKYQCATEVRGRAGW